MPLYKGEAKDVLRVSVRINHPDLIKFFTSEENASLNVSEFLRDAALEVIKTGKWKEWK